MKDAGTTTVAERRSGEAGFLRLDLEHWRVDHGVVAGITTADGGLDLALWGENPARAVMQSWGAFAGCFEPRFRQFVVGHQVHGNLVGVCDAVEPGLLVRGGLDGHATKCAGILLTVLVADCVPVYLLDPGSRAVALLHAGWRGIAGGILAAGVGRLEALGARRRTDIVMHCGVSICGDCYEVGPEVVTATCGRVPDRPGRLDLRGVLAEQAERLGITNVTTSTWCTVHDAGLFHSHRSTGGEAGRMAAYLGVPLS